MKLYFSKGFDRAVYKKNKYLFNEIFIGEQQLLNILERELGLTGIFKPKKEREIEYLAALRRYHDVNRESFISGSFRADDIGTARELLRWRDELKLMNWDFKKGISDRLDLIAELEVKAAVSPGISDRWHNVLSELKKRTEINIESVEVSDDAETIHPFFKELFMKLGEVGVKIAYKKTEIPELSGNNLSAVKRALTGKIDGEYEFSENDNSFQIIRFKDEFTAADFLASQMRYVSGDRVIINNDNNILDSSFRTFGLSAAGSPIPDANPSMVQLLKLLPALMYRQFSPADLIALFNLPALPFPKVLAMKLKKVVVETSGTGNARWNQVIDEYKESLNDEGEKEILKSLSIFVERKRKESVSSTELEEVFSYTSNWAKKQFNLTDSEGLKQQLGILAELSDSIVLYLNTTGKQEYTLREIKKIIGKIYEPAKVDVTKKQKGSFMVVSAPEQLYDNAGTVIWFDFYNSVLKADHSDFLFRDEIEKLSEQNDILIWPADKQIENHLISMMKGVLKAEKRVVLFITEKAHGSDTSVHPLFMNLAKALSSFSSETSISDLIVDFDIEKFPYKKYGWKEPELSGLSRKELPQKEHYIEIKNKEKLKKRQTESFSSVTDLIQYPFDWIMNYQAKITDKGADGTDDIVILKGNLSHLIVQTLLQKHKDGSIDLKDADTDEEIDKHLEELMTQYAAVFTLDENIIEYRSFVSQLKKSFMALLNIINNYGLEFKSFEEEISGEAGGINFTGKVDLLFYKEDRPVVIDLKWTSSENYYSELLQKEQSLQLAVYAAILGNSAVTAYFLLSQGKLLTIDPFFKADEKVSVISVDDPLNMNMRIINRMKNSYQYRWNELSGGKIELGEDLTLNELEYFKDTDIKELVPLNEDKKNKKNNIFSKYGVFKGDVR
jgi:hypothetical protein